MHKGPWEVKNTQRVYKDQFIEVNVDDVEGPDDSEHTYSTVELKPGVAILAFDQDENVYLTEQFRYALNKRSIELVCGGVEKGVEPLEAAQKELREEVGLDARRWEDLGVVDLDTSVVHCPVRLYVARELEKVPSDQEATEDIRWYTVPFAEAVRMVMEGEITHAPSCLLILKHAVGQAG
ncbi:MAG TPA: NUDIX hydrolase [Pyrinomonadaceae bacterium]|nr:NUDIX hydrolase [Pyrinomonadaceae bacterium]